MADFDASASWSGYNYQGKIAIYYALHFINNTSITNYEKFTLMLEAIEDFEILEGDNPRSYHQVKAVDSEYYSKYNDALLGIALQLYKKPNVKGYIHSWKKIKCKDQCATLPLSIKSDIEELVLEYKTSQDKDSSVIGLATSIEKGIPKTASILRDAFGLKDPEQLLKCLEEIVSGTNDCLSRLESYKYEDGNEYCDINDLNSKLLIEIKKTKEIFNLISTEENTERTLCSFLGYLDEYITTRHEDISLKRNKVAIPFFKIIEIVSKNLENPSAEYVFHKFKEIFVEKIEEYIEDEDIDRESEINFTKVTNFLVSLSPRELWEFNRNFTPHQYLNNEETIVNALHIDYRNIQDVLFKILHKIEFEKGYIELDKYRFTYRNNAKPGIFFLPTTIPTNMKLSRIERGFRENKSMSTSLYEVQNYIYMGDVLHKFNPNQQYRENVPFSEDSKENRIKRHEMINEISLIPKIIAIEELIND